MLHCGKITNEEDNEILCYINERIINNLMLPIIVNEKIFVTQLDN